MVAQAGATASGRSGISMELAGSRLDVVRDGRVNLNPLLDFQSDRLWR